ncbi:hypothetical protein E4U59_005948, partial [Claviceps monticola]
MFVRGYVRDSSSASMKRKFASVGIAQLGISSDIPGDVNRVRIGGHGGAARRRRAPGRAPGGKLRLSTSTYMAVSRVKTLDGIMCDAPFDHQSICGRVTPERDPRRLDAVRRQAHHLPAD